MDKEEQETLEKEISDNNSEIKTEAENKVDTDPDPKEETNKQESSPEEKIKELDKKDKNWKRKKIKARFICSLSICHFEKEIACVKGKVEGTISKDPKGNNGFGYDPIFIPIKKKLTFGEMSPKTKYKIDHRYNAFKKIKKFL